MRATLVQRLVLFVICLAVYPQAYAVTNTCPATPALDAFLCNANEEYHTLQLIGEITLLTGAPISGITETPEEAVQHIKPFLTKERNAVFFNTNAGDALNDFYLYWLTMIDDISPRSYEDLSSYQKRCDDRYTDLQERANRLRIVSE